jgi:agmatinase
MSFKHICIAALMIAASATAISVSADPERPTPPAWLEGKLKTLPKEKREFLLSDKAEGIVGSWDKLLMRLKDKSAKEIEAYADGMMELVEAGKFKPGRDLEAEYFDTSAEGYNNWKLRRPAFLDPKRDPGPINLSYYQRGGGGGGTGGVYAGGIATFAGAPVAVYPKIWSRAKWMWRWSARRWTWVRAIAGPRAAPTPCAANMARAASTCTRWSILRRSSIWPMRAILPSTT